MVSSEESPQSSESSHRRRREIHFLLSHWYSSNVLQSGEQGYYLLVLLQRATVWGARLLFTGTPPTCYSLGSKAIIYWYSSNVLQSGEQGYYLLVLLQRATVWGARLFFFFFFFFLMRNLPNPKTPGGYHRQSG